MIFLLKLWVITKSFNAYYDNANPAKVLNGFAEIFDMFQKTNKATYMRKRPPAWLTSLPIILVYLLSGCTHTPPQRQDDDRIVHLLNRISFGPTGADIDEVHGLGAEAYIEQQLKPATLEESEQLNKRLSELSTLHASLKQLSEDFQPPAANLKNMSEDERKEVNQNKNRIVSELARAKVLRAILSPAQLQEVMTDFWFNHFNVFAEKGDVKIWIGGYERDAIRPYALGKFRDLLHAVARHPAMLFYLDNWQNTRPDSPGAQKRRQGINENYARELLELHTLGVDGGYTQQDVTTLAQILTGWGLSEGKELWQRAEFMFDPRRHDFTEKTLLGMTIAGGGAAEIETVLDKLAAHPATARHIAYQLAQNFVADDPPPALVGKLAAVFQHSGGDIAAVLRALFKSGEFWDRQYTGNKFKPPFRYVISALRAADAVPPADAKLIQGALRNMGEPLYHCLTPNGYANSKESWLNPDALLKRIDFAKGLSKFVDSAATGQNIQQSLGGVWSKNTLDTVRESPAGLKPMLWLNSPEFLYY